MQPEKRLWCAVIAQAFVDASVQLPVAPKQWKWGLRRQRNRKKRGKPLNTRSELQDAWESHMRNFRDNVRSLERDRDTARAWLIGRVPGLQTIAGLAGVNHEYIVRKAEAISTNGWQLRNAERFLEAQAA